MARAQADLLVGAEITTPACIKLEGGRLRYPAHDRARILEAVGYVTEFDHPRAENIIPTVLPDFLVKG